MKHYSVVAVLDPYVDRIPLHTRVVIATICGVLLVVICVLSFVGYRSYVRNAMTEPKPVSVAPKPAFIVTSADKQMLMSGRPVPIELQIKHAKR